MKTHFLILHGYGGSAGGHWQPYLAKFLEDRKANVIFPIFPNFDHPKLKDWIEALEKKLADIDLDSLVVAGHSLGCTLWLHFAASHPKIKPQKVFLIAPPLNDCGIEEIEDFFPLPLLDLKKQNDRYLMIYSNNDPFIGEKEFETIAKNLQIQSKMIPNVGHINISTGFGKWDWIERECNKYL